MPKQSLTIDSSSPTLYLRYQQSPSLLILTISPLSPLSQPSCQNGLHIDISIRDTAEQEKLWAALEYRLRDLFERVVLCAAMPGCQVKVNVFVLEGQGEGRVQGAIVNGIALGFGVMGLPMRHGVYAFAEGEENKQTSKIANCIVLNTSSEQLQPIYGKYSPGSLAQPSEQLHSEIQEYKNLLISAINRNIAL